MLDSPLANTLPVAVIGLGSMGFGIAATLLRTGFAVTGYDIAPATATRFATLGGAVATSPAEAAERAAIIISVVVDADQTEAVLFGESGCAAAMLDGAVFVSSATMAPEMAQGLAARLERQGKLYLDAPVSGGAQRALDGQLTVFASGTPAALAAARPVLDAVAAKVYELGATAGLAAGYKMVNQLLAGVHIAAACEAITFAARQGLDIAKVYETITASAGNSWMFENRVPRILDGDYTARSAVNIFVKDLGIIMDMARTNVFPAALAGTALQMFLMTAAAGMGKDDDASVARLLAQVTGIELPKARPC